MALYADDERGRYPVWQSLDHPNFLPNSKILFVTVTVGNTLCAFDQAAHDMFTGRLFRASRSAVGRASTRRSHERGTLDVPQCDCAGPRCILLPALA